MISVVLPFSLSVAMLAFVLVWGVAASRGEVLQRRAALVLLPLSQMLAVALLGASHLWAVQPVFISWCAFAVSALCTALDVVVLRRSLASFDRDLAEERMRVATIQAQAQRDRAAQFERQLDEVQTMRSCLAQRLHAMADRLGEGDVEGMFSILEQDGRLVAEKRDGAGARSFAAGLGEGECRGVCIHRFCDHDAVDALLAMAEKACGQAEVEVTYRVVLSEGIGIPDVDVCAAFSNILDNALAAASAAPDGKRFIDLKARQDGPMLVINAENGFAPDAASRDSGKRRRERTALSHGWGLSILDSLAARYGGLFESAPQGEVWVTTLVMRAQ